MAEVIKQQPPVTEQVTQEALNKAGYKAGASFVKAITDKVSGIVQNLSAYNIKQQFKDKGAIGIAGDAVKSLFRKRKQAPIIEETLERTDTSKQAPVQGTLKGILPESTNLKTAEQQNETAPAPLKTDITPETNKSAQQLELPGFEQPEQPKEKKLIQTEEKAKTVLIGGITDEGIRNFKEKLPDLFEEIFKKLPKTETKPQDLKTQYSEKGLLGMLPKGLLAMGGGLALLLGGLAALVTGLQTDGPFKGLLKIFSKVGIEGGLKMLEKGAKTFLKTLESFIKAPTKLLQSVYKSLRGVFGKGVARGITKLIKPVAGLFTKLASGIVKVVTPFLKRLPLIGTIISWGFAYTRFKSGDTIGGIIDILSGVATLFPGVGTAISIGLDVLNAFLDYKTGGASPEASAKKAGMIGDFFGSIWDWIKEKAVRVFGWFVDLGKLIAQAKWGDVFQKLAGWIPGLDWMLGWLGTSSEQLQEKGNTLGQQYIDVIASFTDWVKTNILDKITGFVGGIVDKFKAVGSFLGFGEEEPEIPEVDIPKGRKSARGSKPKLKDGGVISEDTTALVGEAGDEAVIPLAKGGVVATQPTTTPIKNINETAVVPLEKYFNGKDFSLSNNTLSQIASNTGSTNDGLKVLGQAILKLAQVFNEKNNTTSNNISINGQQQNQYPSASQIAANNIDPIRQIRAQFAI